MRRRWSRRCSSRGRRGSTRRARTIPRAAAAAFRTSATRHRSLRSRRRLTTELGNAIRNRVRAWAREERLVAYDQAEQSGYLRHLVVREGRNTGQVLVHLVTAAGEKFDTGHFVDVLREFPEVRSVHWSEN